MSNLLATFFARNNATRTVAGVLLTLVSLATLAQTSGLIPEATIPLVGALSAALAVVAMVLRQASVFTWGLALTALYSTAQTLLDLQSTPDSWRKWLAFLVGAISLVQMQFSRWRPTDAPAPGEETTPTYIPRRSH